MGNLSILRGALASAQVSSYTTGTITLPSARGAFVPANEPYQSIATTTVSSPVATVTFSSIPATFTHLQLRVVSKTTDTAVGEDSTNLYFNADTTYTNYRSHWIRGNGTSISASTIQASGYNIYAGIIPTSGSGQTGYFGASVIDILDYTNTNKFKTVRTFNGDNMMNVSYNFIGFYTSLWKSTAAITDITFTVPGGTNYAQYSKFALYGIKGS